jgi:hypothetical protein
VGATPLDRARLGFDATPDYFAGKSGKRSQENMLQFYAGWVPKLRFIVLLRSPTDRVRSYFNHFCGSAYLEGKRGAGADAYIIKQQQLSAEERAARATCGDFETWVQHGMRKVQDSGCAQASGAVGDAQKALCDSIYVSSLEMWLKSFAPSQFLLVPFSGFIQDPRPALIAVGKHTGLISPIRQTEITGTMTEAAHSNVASEHSGHTRRLGSRSTKSKMPESLKHSLDTFFLPHNKKLQTLVVDNLEIALAYRDRQALQGDPNALF